MTRERKHQSSTGRSRARWTALLVWPAMVGVVLAKLAQIVSPAACIYLAPFGLLFPWSLLLLWTGLAAGLLHRKWRQSLLPMLVALWAIPEMQRTVGGMSVASPRPEQEAAIDQTLEVVTWNVRQFDRYGWLEASDVKDQILGTLRTTDADIVCLQEAYLRIDFLTRPQLWSAAGVHEWHRNFGSASDPSNHYGLVTLSKHPIVGKEEIWFDEDPSNACIATDIAIDGEDTIRVFNVHLSSNRFDPADLEAVRRGPDAAERARVWSRLSASWHQRSKQAEIVAAAAEESPYPVIVAGDFNDGPVSYALGQFRCALDDAFSSAGSGIGATYIGKLPGLRIDYILHSPALAPTDFETMSTRLSDHRPVRAAFSL